MKHRLLLLWSWLVALLTNWMPECLAVRRLRGRLYGLGMRRCGRDFQVASGVYLAGLEYVAVGHHVYFARGTVLLAGEEVEIEDEVMLAPYCVVSDGNHTLCDASYRFGPRRNAPVRIGRGTWIAAHCTVVAGVRIGRGVLVAANSVVTRDVEDETAVGGVPARLLSTAFLPSSKRAG